MLLHSKFIPLPGQFYIQQKANTELHGGSQLIMVSITLLGSISVRFLEQLSEMDKEFSAFTSTIKLLRIMQMFSIGAMGLEFPFTETTL
jgi:hypothetical protein